MAQLDSASDSDSDGWRFKSAWVYHSNPATYVVGFSLPSCVLVPFADAIGAMHNNRYYARSSLQTRLGVDKTEFKKYFQGSHKIHYLIGYLKGYDENSRSTYAKYLTVEVIKKLLDKGFDCTPLLISN